VNFTVLWKESRVFRQVLTFQRYMVPSGSGNKLKDTGKRGCIGTGVTNRHSDFVIGRHVLV